ncbi:MAG: hypothetical protein ACLGH4_04280 [Actinomycetes bacterium]
MTPSGDEPQERPDPSGPEGDYSYDLVHDEVPTARRGEHAVDRPHEETPPHTDADAGGDYSYDLAHEVPPSRRG